MNPLAIIALGLVIVGVVIATSEEAQASLPPSDTPTDTGGPIMNDHDAIYPRGIRNNNPFNIIYEPYNNWQGQTGNDGKFCIFAAPEDGYRAGFILLHNWVYKDGIPPTVEALISRQAPPSENFTEAYIAAVCRALGVARNQPLNIDDQGTLFALAQAITKQEQGGQPWGDDIVVAGLNAAVAAQGAA